MWAHTANIYYMVARNRGAKYNGIKVKSRAQNQEGCTAGGREKNA